MLSYDVNQYCEKENLMLLFKTHTKQYLADLLQRFGPEIGPLSWFTCLYCLTTGFQHNTGKYVILDLTDLLGMVLMYHDGERGT